MMYKEGVYFAAGAVVGSVATFVIGKILERRHRKKIESHAKEIKTDEEQKEDPYNEEDYNPITAESYRDVINQFGYESPEETNFTPHQITAYEYEEGFGDYESAEFVYYEDGVIADSLDPQNRIVHPEAVFGELWKYPWDMNPALDETFYRDEENHIQYQLTRDIRTWSELYGDPDDADYDNFADLDLEEMIEVVRNK